MCVGLTEAFSAQGNEREAGHYLNLAHKTFPDRYEEDPNFAYTHFSALDISSFEGMMHLHLGQPQKAWEAFLQLDERISRTPIPGRIELTVRQAATSYALNERDQSCAYLESAVRGALAAGNNLRFDEAYAVFERMQRRWGKEPQVKALSQLFL